MNENTKSKSGNHVQLAVDLLIKLGVLVLLLVWCFKIIEPFISIVFWAVIIAVTLLPAFNALALRLGNRKKLAATIFTLLLLAIIIIPSGIFTDSIIIGIQDLSTELDSETFTVPAPPAEVADWPIIGNAVYSTWDLASDNLEKVVLQYSEQLKVFGKWFINALMGTGIGLLQFLISIIIAGIFLAISERGGAMSRKLFKRIVGERGEEFVQASVITIRNVAKGVLGVSFIQSMLAGIIFLAAGVPYAGLWALLALILCIIQLGPGLVIIPVIIYLFTVSSAWVAIIWMILLIVVMLSDNILKPILMGKGAPVPMLVIFMGSIGGFIASGFMGLFLGAIVLSLGYMLFLSYINEEETIKKHLQ